MEKSAIAVCDICEKPLGRRYKEWRGKVIHYTCILNLLVQVFNEIDDFTPEEVDEILRETGHDPEEMGQRMAAFAKKLLIEEEARAWRQKMSRWWAEYQRIYGTFD